MIYRQPTVSASRNTDIGEHGERLIGVTLKISVKLRSQDSVVGRWPALLLEYIFAILMKHC